VGLLGTRFTETAGLLGEFGHGIVHALQQNRSSIAPLIWSAEEIGGLCNIPPEICFCANIGTRLASSSTSKESKSSGSGIASGSEFILAPREDR
jgi:hypothetical protein